MPAFLWAPFVAVIVATLVVFFAVSDNAAWFVVYGGTVLVLFGLTIYALVDSRRRWPGLSTSQRLSRIFTFYNG